MTALLKDPEKATELSTQGYVKLPMLNEEELSQLRIFYHTMHPDGAPEKIDGIHMTTWCRDRNYKLSVRDEIKRLYARGCAEHFADFRTLNQVFIVKDPGETTFKVHQDWSIVDESEHVAINVWVPLYDVNEEDGALWVLPGSHRIDRHVRGSAYLFPDFSPHFGSLEKAAKSVSLKAGEAIVFYLNVIHGSPANQGTRERVATCFSVIPKHAPLCIYFQKKAGDPLEVHVPDDDFMYQYTALRTETLERPPSTQPSQVLPSFVTLPVTKEEIAPYLGLPQTTRKKGILSWFRLS